MLTIIPPRVGEETRSRSSAIGLSRARPCIHGRWPQFQTHAFRSWEKARLHPCIRKPPMDLAAAERKTINDRLRFILWLASIFLRSCHRVVEPVVEPSFFSGLSLLSKQGHIFFVSALIIDDPPGEFIGSAPCCAICQTSGGTLQLMGIAWSVTIRRLGASNVQTSRTGGWSCQSAPSAERPRGQSTASGTTPRS